MPSDSIERYQCAAITNGCMSALVVPSGFAATMLELNGWHDDHGRTVCGNHPVRPAPSPALPWADPDRDVAADILDTWQRAHDDAYPVRPSD